MKALQLPLLEYAASLTPNVNFENVLLVTCQHILESTALMLDSFFERGLKPSNTYLLGKVYSTSLEVQQELLDRGMYVHPASSQFDSYVAFDEHHNQAAKELWQEVMKRTDLQGFEKVVVLDDGGQLIIEAHKQLNDFSKIVAVEWTSAGFHALQEEKLLFPVINMARSDAKLRLESPFIAELAVSESLKYFQKANLNPKRVLVVGGGFIGTNIATRLATTYDVQRFDIVSQKSDLTQNELDAILHLFDVIVSATGKTVLDPEDFSLLKKDVVLISSSSSDREFNAVHLRRKAPRTSNPHDDLIIEGIHLMRCGFPVTFDGSRQLIPFSKIQLTVSLAYVSVMQVLQTDFVPGIQEVNRETQQKLINKFAELGTAS